MSDLYVSPEAMKDIMDWVPSQEIADLIFDRQELPGDTLLLNSRKCPDCTDGKYYGFNTIETCKTCDGTSIIIDGIQEFAEAINRPLYYKIEYSFGLGFQHACGMGNGNNLINYNLHSVYPIPKSGIINNFRTTITSDTWGLYDKYTFGDNNEKIFVNSKGEVQLILDFGFYICFMVNDSHLLNIFQDVESKTVFVTYEDIDKMLGAYI